MKQKASKKGVHPLLAVLLLAVGLLVFAWKVVPLLRRADARLGPADPAALAPAAADDAEGVDPEDGQLGDLLAQYGSYRPGTPVRCSFAGVDPGMPPAAPAGETLPQGGGGWVGGDPPQLRVSFLMIGGPVARAVVDGVVVGVGDTVAGGRVTAIRADCVVLRAGARTLTYGMDASWPREVARELQQRAENDKTGEGKGR
jgi:hypothetical protein